ncbi:hypothetical protein [Deinococcus petrolearius]|uniref:Uncharacterized protein n=1 Tax=Deinococcus petrolearius TaxID=1751295 RepID=A0ABW1DD80_9DEIO
MADDRTYDASLLTALNVESREFALTWTRTLLRDLPEVETGGVPLGPGQPARPRAATWPEFSLTDQQIGAALALDAVLDERPAPPRLYYRPHVTAARLYLGNPNLWRSRAVDGSSESRRDSSEIVGAWLSQGAGLDRMIPADLPLPPFVLPGTDTDAATRDPERPVSVVVRALPGW